jgi:multicomponent Na+:H+ antiporter subunit D
MNLLILVPIFLPLILGGVLLALPKGTFFEEPQKGIGRLSIYTLAVLFVSGAVVLWDVLALEEQDQTLTLLHVTKGVSLYFHIDDLGGCFALLVTLIWILAGIFSYEYMKHEEHQKRYFAFYLLSYGVLIGLDFAGNLVTMYLFYELMTILSMPLVLHEQSHEAIMAGLKYLMYSFCGAYLALFGLFFLNRYCDTLNFTVGGTLNAGLAAGHEGLLLLVVFCMILGFGVKAGMFPMHAWLPTAHPVAPSPASAVLSGIIVKSGVLAIIRVVYYLVGPSFIAGTWVQHAWLILSLITVFMGSLLAYREPLLKKRLAYSTVSQLSYILFGLAILDPTAAAGSLLHVIFHAVIKTALFLCAGAFISHTGQKQVAAMRGIGKTMPVILWCYTFVSLGLIGIPPFSGFISKWYLATGALSTGMSVYSWLGPVVLLVSALLTAGYLLPITIDGFLPGADYQEKGKRREPLWMVVPLVILAALTLLLGVFPNPLIEFLSGITSAWF